MAAASTLPCYGVMEHVHIQHVDLRTESTPQTCCGNQTDMMDPFPSEVGPDLQDSFIQP